MTTSLPHMHPIHDRLRRIATILAIVVLPLLGVATGTAAAHSGATGGMMGGGMDGFGGFGMFGGGLFLWPLVLLGIGLILAYSLRSDGDKDDVALAELRDRYARGELSEEEFETRRVQLYR